MNFWDQNYQTSFCKSSRCASALAARCCCLEMARGAIAFGWRGKATASRRWIARCRGWTKHGGWRLKKALLWTSNWPIWKIGHPNLPVLTPFCSPTCNCPPTGARRPCSAWRGGCVAVAGLFWSITPPAAGLQQRRPQRCQHALHPANSAGRFGHGWPARDAGLGGRSIPSRRHRPPSPRLRHPLRRAAGCKLVKIPHFMGEITSIRRTYYPKCYFIYSKF